MSFTMAESKMILFQEENYVKQITCPGDKSWEDAWEDKETPSNL